jgi:TRAP-type C4-dicarboxylate transport system substrate-binding protein
MGMKKRWTIPMALTAAAVLTTGCTGTTVDKSGSQRVYALVMANNDGSLDGAPAVSHFIDRVKQLSGGTVTIKVESPWRGGGDERRVITDVAAGHADLGWSGTRALDTVGITAFQPLHAPLLISSYAAQAAVVKDPATQNLLASLSPKGLEGLAVLADELRHPAAATKPLLAPADFRDLRFGTQASQVQEAALRSLGALPETFRAPHPPDTDGLDALETMWWTYRANSQAGFVPFITGNVALWPRTTVVFANAERIETLDATAREWLKTAAADARDWSVLHAADRVRAELAEACIGGARVAFATDAQLTALRAAAEPAYAALRQDPTNAKTLARFEELVKTQGPDAVAPVPSGCAYIPGNEADRPVPVPALQGPGRPGRVPQGMYRYVITMDELRSLGMSDEFVRANAGVWTWTLGRGRWSYELQPSSNDQPVGWAGNTCAGYFDASGDTVNFTRVTDYAQGDCAPPTWMGRWSATKGDLKWLHMPIDGNDLDFLYAGKLWERIE